MRRRGCSYLTTWPALIALAACGRINYQPVPPRDSAAIEDAGAPDGLPEPGNPDGAASPSCPANAPFSSPAVLTVVGLDPDLYGPRLSFDGLTLFLSQTRGNPFKDEDIWVAGRSATNADRFENAERFERLVSPAFDGSAFPTHDILEIFFSSARPGGAGNRDLWVVRRAQPNDAFSDPVALSVVNSAANDQNPSLTDDGLLLFFASDRDGAAPDDDIYVSLRTSKSGAFSRPVKAPGLSSPAKDGAPFITGDGRAIYFSSDRPGGRGGLDIWTATRGDRQLGFGTPTLVPAVNSAGHDEDPSISPDGSELLFSSNRDGKNSLLYRAVRCP